MQSSAKYRREVVRGVVRTYLCRGRRRRRAVAVVAVAVAVVLPVVPVAVGAAAVVGGGDCVAMTMRAVRALLQTRRC